MLFTLKDLQRQIPANTLSRGLSLLQSRQVSGADIHHNGELITGTVYTGQTKHPYRAYIKIRKINNSTLIDGECTCRNAQCEHATAVLMAALENAQQFDRNDTSKLTSLTKEQMQADQQLCYFLYPRASVADAIDVGVRVSKLSPKGALVHGMPYRSSRFNVNNTPRFVREGDAEILVALSQLPETPFSSNILLYGEHAAQILTAMLQTQRCFLEKLPQKPILTGDGRPMEFHWHKDKYYVQYPTWRSSPPADFILLFSDPYYIDATGPKCGTLHSPLSQSALIYISSLAPVEPDQAGIQQVEINSRFPADNIPALNVFKEKHITPKQPIPCLQLRTDTIDSFMDRQERNFSEYDVDTDENLEEDRIHVAYLAFDYDGQMIIYPDMTYSVDENTIYYFKRNTSFEEKCFRRLEELEFIPLEDVLAYANNDFAFYLSDDAPDWIDFQLDGMPALTADGWRVEIHDSFALRVRHAQDWIIENHADERDWFDISIGIDLEGKRMNLLPVISSVIRHYGDKLRQLLLRENTVINLPDGTLLSIPSARLTPLVDVLLALHDNTKDHGDTEHLRLSRYHLAHLTEYSQDEDDTHITWLGHPQARDFIQRLKQIDQVPPTMPPKNLTTQLRHYQQRGLDWLQFLREYELAGILADDMGLGKTVQTLAHLLLEKQQGRLDRPCLIVVPTSLVFNWRRETQQFAPDLSVICLHGPARQQYFASIKQYDLIITTYTLLSRDEDVLVAQPFHYVVLDEAHNVKNPRTKAARSLRNLTTRHRLCLTGTPLENHLGELWSLFDFLMPGFLGAEKRFQTHFRRPIEKQGDNKRAAQLAARVRPFLLRRLKREVATELPPRTDIVRSVMLQGAQLDLYETVRVSVYKQVRDAIAEQGLARSHITILDALLKLRQVCCDPRLVKLKHNKSAASSAKLELLLDILPELIEEGRRILLFSQFTSMLSLIENELRALKIEYAKLTGQTQKRAEQIDRFQHKEVPLFLISLKAGGTGLNLTAADTVIHYDPWWNPAVEEQAIGRAHRIGQHNPVFVYKLICEGTVEEKIMQMQQHKLSLAQSIYSDDKNNEPQWTQNDIEHLLSPIT